VTARKLKARISLTQSIQADSNQLNVKAASISDQEHNVRYQINLLYIQIAAAVAGIKNAA